MPTRSNRSVEYETRVARQFVEKHDKDSSGALSVEEFSAIGAGEKFEQIDLNGDLSIEMNEVLHWQFPKHDAAALGKRDSLAVVESELRAFFDALGSTKQADATQSKLALSLRGCRARAEKCAWYLRKFAAGAAGRVEL